MVLLSGFDEYLLGYQGRGAVLAPEHGQRIVPGGNGVFKPTIVIGGKVVGTWSRLEKRTETVIQPMPFRPLRKAEREALFGAAERYGGFIGRPVRVIL